MHASPSTLLAHPLLFTTCARLRPVAPHPRGFLPQYTNVPFAPTQRHRTKSQTLPVPDTLWRIQLHFLPNWPPIIVNVLGTPYGFHTRPNSPERVCSLRHSVLHITRFNPQVLCENSSTGMASLQVSQLRMVSTIIEKQRWYPKEYSQLSHDSGKPESCQLIGDHDETFAINSGCWVSYSIQSCFHQK